MIKTSKLSIRTKGNTDIINITDQVQSTVSNSNIKNGCVIIFVTGSTAAVTTLEYEPGLIKDLKEVFEKIAPQEKDYAHNAKWGDGNGHAHVRASLLKPDLNIPVIDGDLSLGTWQQIILCDFDNKSRGREIVIQVIGE